LTSNGVSVKMLVDKRSAYITNNPLVNHHIKSGSLRVIDESGQQLGILSKEEALRLAQEAGFDLVEISPNANPPVAKIIDYGKYNYQRTKQLQKNKRNAKVQDLKQMRYGLKIGDHDLQVKNGKVRQFLESGDKVRITVIYRGRELAHKEIGYTLLDRILENLGEIAMKEHEPQFAGKQLSVVVRSNNAKAKNA
jgi:translation initiation factor IF-3